MSSSIAIPKLLLAFKSSCKKPESGRTATALSNVGVTSEHLPSSTNSCFAANIDDAETGAACLGIPLEKMKWLSRSSKQSAVRSVDNQSMETNSYKDLGEGFSTSIEVSAHTGSISGNVAASERECPSSDQGSTPQEGLHGPDVTVELPSVEKSHTKKDDGHDRIINKKYRSYPKGWPQMAAFQNSCDNSAIVRRFGTARFRILLHLQAEVADIEEELDKLDASDEKTGPDSELDLRYRLRYNVRKLGCGDPAQEKLIERLKEKLAEYDEWVQRDHALRSLPAASEFDYMNLFNWVWGNQPLADGHYDFMLRSDDFVHLSGKKEAGIAERFIFNSCLRRWPRFRLMQSRKHDQGSTQVNEVFFFSESRIALAAKLLSVCVAVTVLMIPVFLLYLTKMDPKAISIIVLMFVLAFATIVSLFTDAKMETVFVGTCA